MNLRKALPVATWAGLTALGLGLFAQDAPSTNQRPRHERMQERRGAMMQGHQEIADAVSQVRENIAKLRQETDVAKVQAGLAENEKLLVELEGKLASRRTMMQLRMPPAEPEAGTPHEGH